MAELSFAEVDALLKYDPETGKLFWKDRPVASFQSLRIANGWNSKFAGKEAFTANSHGYRRGAINCIAYSAHRIAWLLHYGEWPINQLDHINGDRSDNRVVNLRDVDQSTNNRNARKRSSNKSGFEGVFWDGWTRQWSITFRQLDGTRAYKRTTGTKEEAAVLLDEIKSSLNYTHRHGT